MGGRSKRGFVQMLRLLETFPAEEVQDAVQDAVGRGVTGYDAVKHLLLCRIEGRTPRLGLDLYPHLPSVSDRPPLLLEHHLKELKLPTFLTDVWYGRGSRHN